MITSLKFCWHTVESSYNFEKITYMKIGFATELEIMSSEYTDLDSECEEHTDID
jgi:hypothetical protein